MYMTENYDRSQAALISEKEKRAFEAKAICENLNDGSGITISRKENSDDYIVFQCEYKSDSYLYKWTEDDIYKMSADELKTKLHTASEMEPPANFDRRVFSYCKSIHNQCIPNGPLSILSISMTTACNAKCKFCDIKSLKPVKKNEKELYFDILNKIKGIGVNSLLLTSDGEPFFYKKETLDYIDTLKSDTCKTLIIYTNATLINKDDIKHIYDATTRNGIKCRIMCSCSAITPETYKLVHGTDNFYKVVENIKYINELGLLQNINYVIIPENLHELEFYKQFWHEQGVMKTSSTVVHDYCCKGAAKIVYESAEYRRFIEAAN